MTSYFVLQKYKIHSDFDNGISFWRTSRRWLDGYLHNTNKNETFKFQLFLYIGNELIDFITKNMTDKITYFGALEEVSI